MKYSRSFMPLIKPDNPRRIVGKAIIEMRDNACKVFIWANELQEYISHELYFLRGSGRKNSAVFVCGLNSDSDNIAGFRYNFDFSGLEELVENFDALLVFDSENTKIKLIGYRKKYFFIDNKFDIIQKDEFIVQNAEIKLKPTESKIEDEASIKAAQAKSKVEQANVNNPAKIRDEKTLFFEKLKLMMVNNIQMSPFERQNRNVSWARVNIRDIENLFFMKDFERRGIINEQFKKFRHLILGHVKDYSGENFYFGVPYIYSKAQRNLFLKLGFCQFKCCDFVRPVEGEYGYWLIKL